VGSSAEVNELFGFALAAGDFDRDRHADLAIGVPGEDVVDPLDNAGAVNVLYGGAAGLTGSGSQFFTQNTPGVGGTAEDGDLFGLVTAGDFDRDRYPDLAIGVLQESVGSIGNAGAVNVLYGGRAGLTGSGGQYFTQNTPGVASSAEQFDGFGRALAAGDFDGDRHADLAIGVPEEHVGSINAAGAVNVLYGGRPGLAGSGSQFFTQNTRGWAAPPRTATCSASRWLRPPAGPHRRARPGHAFNHATVQPAAGPGNQSLTLPVPFNRSAATVVRSPPGAARPPTISRATVNHDLGGFVALTSTGRLGMLRPHAADTAYCPTDCCSLSVRRLPVPA
jgi:hypothetical protein